MTTARGLLQGLMGSLSGAAAGAGRMRSERRARLLARALRTLISGRGEASGAVLARRCLSLYRGLDEHGRWAFFDLLARDFSPDPERVLEAARRYSESPSPATLRALQRVVEPDRQEVFRRMNMAAGGTAAILEMRRALLSRMKAQPELEFVDQDLQHLLGSWFNRGFLELRRIDWRTPASILEKLIAYEAVHEIRGFPDLKRRLERDRRCFAFFHPALEDEPLIFVEVAFVDELPSAVAPILSMESAVGDPKRARCAVFYSITSCQPGLKGISFGNFLIKQVAQDLHKELPNLRIFATLSPIPGLAKWAERHAPSTGRDREALEGLAAWYLTRSWHESHVHDPVARFHLGNGARLERINWEADASAKGMAQSFGLMVNYIYDLAYVEKNHEDYVSGHHVACSSRIERLAERAAHSLGPGPDSAAKAAGARN